MGLQIHGRAATLLGRRRRRGWAATRAFSERRLAVHLQHRHSQLHVPCRSAGAPSDGPSWTATTPPRSSLGAPLLASELDWELRGQTPLVIFADGLAPRGNDAFIIIIITYGRQDLDRLQMSVEQKGCVRLTKGCVRLTKLVYSVGAIKRKLRMVVCSSSPCKGSVAAIGVTWRQPLTAVTNSDD